MTISGNTASENCVEVFNFLAKIGELSAKLRNPIIMGHFCRNKALDVVVTVKLNRTFR